MNKWLKELIPYVVIIILVFVLKIFVVTPIKVNGESMDPTLKNKDIMLLDKIGYSVKEKKRFDIVVIHDHNTEIIKRIIGLPGEVVEYKDNKLYIDGVYVKEPFKHGKTDDFQAKKLGKNEYYVLGDNREDSLDSRILGPIFEKYILGRATYTIYPFSRFGEKK